MFAVTPDLVLKPEDLHLWLAFPDEITDPLLLSRYKELMAPEEKAQHQRFYFEKDRHLYLLTRALIRTTLSRYFPLKPEQWIFSRNAYGRSEIVREPGVPHLRFNLSHTAGLVICGITLKQDIGVDVENIERNHEMVSIANRYFSKQEVQELLSLPAAEQPSRFYDYWTLKESYIKARGMGLSLPLEQFSLNISNHPSLSISFDPSLKDVSKHWQFWLIKPTRHHRTALALRNDTDLSYKLSMKKVIPFLGEQPFHCPILKQPTPPNASFGGSL
ncbi:4'-phosphopantetheinyl transferase superfamily protein [Deltaproteobacteria bacterium TL4]